MKNDSTEIERETLLYLLASVLLGKRLDVAYLILSIVGVIAIGEHGHREGGEFRRPVKTCHW